MVELSRISILFTCAIVWTIRIDRLKLRKRTLKKLKKEWNHCFVTWTCWSLIHMENCWRKINFSALLRGSCAKIYSRPYYLVLQYVQFLFSGSCFLFYILKNYCPVFMKETWIYKCTIGKMLFTKTILAKTKIVGNWSHPIRPLIIWAHCICTKFDFHHNKNN